MARRDPAAAGSSKTKSSASIGTEDDVLDDVVVPPDLPLEAIAEEVQNSWHLKVSLHASMTASLILLCSSSKAMLPELFCPA